MMRMRMKKGGGTKDMGMGVSSGNGNGNGNGRGEEEGGWELRPGGMVVQTRDASADQEAIPPRKITVRVIHGPATHLVSINMQGTFGELKKLIAADTGLDPQDQKIIFKRKERDNKEFLDLSGVKERSKIVVMEDPLSREKRYIEMRKTAKAEKASRAIAEISLDVDKLATQVQALEGLINKGKRVAENDLVQLTESLMRKLVTLDGFAVEGDAKQQKRIQIRRVQKHIETLDALKLRNVSQNNSPHPSVVVTTKWETFDS